ncbi:hypothetical protein IFO70_05175 [Phormidium tenue FACHB-886]|nr:hypothetical protein [Phormidium tenue FACHB-886]
MALSYPANRKKFQIPWKSIVRPMLLASLGLHALFLLFPLSADQPIKPPEQKPEEKISLTQLPPQESILKTPASPNPQVQPSRVTPRVTPRVTTVQRTPAVPRPSVAVAPAAAPSPPAAQPSPAASPVVENTASAADPFAADFPQYPNDQPGSFGLPAAFDPFSRKTADSMEQVSGWFQSQMQATGFLAQPVTQAGRTVYQVSKDGKSKFLSLIPNAQGAGTSIILSDQLLPDDLGSSNVVSPEEQAFYQNLAEIIQDANPDSAWQDLDNPRILPEPSAFYARVVSEQEYLSGSISELQPGIERKVVHVGQTPEALFADIATMMQTAEIEVAPQGTYGDGALYQLSRDGVTRFLSLVPTQDGNTAIFIWTNSPNEG